MLGLIGFGGFRQRVFALHVDFQASQTVLVLLQAVLEQRSLGGLSLARGGDNRHRCIPQQVSHELGTNAARSAVDECYAHVVVAVVV